jgi:hypothetical protein
LRETDPPEGQEAGKEARATEAREKAEDEERGFPRNEEKQEQVEG